MKKIVPDPPCATPQSLQSVLTETANNLTQALHCASEIAFTPQYPDRHLAVNAMRQIESARVQVNKALQHLKQSNQAGAAHD